MQLKVVKPFDWAHEHVRIESFQKDQLIETSDQDLIRVSLEEKWTMKNRSSEPGAKTEGKSKGNSPENKALSGSAENK